MPAQEPLNPEQVLTENATLIEDEELRSYYPLFLRNVMGLSTQVEHRVMDGIRVAYAGVPGAFAALAAHKIFHGCREIPYPDFRAAYEAVEAGESDCAVLPIENSYAGDVAQVMDLAYFGSLYINGVYDVRINQCLLGTPDATLDGVTEVVSHPQALSQCAEYLASRGVVLTEASNTAVAARRVAQEGDPTVAAIGSPEAAELYGLKILASNINESNTNTTRFAVFTRVPHLGGANDGQFIMTFTVKNEAGALAKAISILGDCGFNMRSLKSRPTKKLIWSNFFYLEGEGNLSSDAGEEMLKRLSAVCSGLKVLGSFDREVYLED
jgi:chorismate mutase/prephenate dehydratase